MPLELLLPTLLLLFKGRLNNSLGESLFWYPAGLSSDDFHDVDFTPLYDLSSFSEEERQEALDNCNGNTACQYDLLLTKNEELGQAALDIGAENEVEKRIVGRKLLFFLLLSVTKGISSTEINYFFYRKGGNIFAHYQTVCTL